MFAEAIKRRLPLYKSGPQVGRVAIAFSGEGHTSFSEVQNIAAAIIRGAEDVVNSPYPLIVVVENDIGKVLGNALAAELGDGKDIVSIDGISVANGDYIDIGEPIAGGARRSRRRKNVDFQFVIKAPSCTACNVTVR